MRFVDAFKYYQEALNTAKDKYGRALKQNDPEWLFVNQVINYTFESVAQEFGFQLKGVGAQGNAASEIAVKFLYSFGDIQMKVSRGLYPFVVYIPEHSVIQIRLARSTQHLPTLALISKIEDEIAERGGYIRPTEPREENKELDGIHERRIMRFNSEAMSNEEALNALRNLLAASSQTFEAHREELIEFLNR